MSLKIVEATVEDSEIINKTHAKTWKTVNKGMYSEGQGIRLSPSQLSFSKKTK